MTARDSFDTAHWRIDAVIVVSAALAVFTIGVFWMRIAETHEAGSPFAWGVLSVAIATWITAFVPVTTVWPLVDLLRPPRLWRWQTRRYSTEGTLG